MSARDAAPSVPRTAIWDDGYHQGFEDGAATVDAILAARSANDEPPYWWMLSGAAAGSLLALAVLGIAGADRVAGLLVRAGCL